MLLKLHHSEVPQRAACAAFIRGGSPAEWLKEIDRWGIAPGQLECYVMPESIRSVEPAGLFVISKAGQKHTVSDYLEPYGVMAGKLFLPVNSILVPEISAEQLADIMLWECQVFHPSIGLVGFEKADRIDLAELLDTREPCNTDWRLAHPGLPKKSRLKEIHVQMPSVTDVMESFREDIEQKPLSEIPGNEEAQSNSVSRLMDDIKRGGLKGALFASGKLKDLLKGSDNSDKGANQSSGSVEAGGQAGSGGGNLDSPGLLDRIHNWAKQNLEDLERKRRNEIERLLNLFDNNIDEALKYAIPIGGPYHNRGTAPPSATLGPRSVSFSLGSLGGGQRVDNWNVDPYYDDLRIKYQKAAQKAIEQKDFKKAAYVYAHLLGDFYSAANVLEQGKHYREAAVLYKDHLKNIPAAAECLERGGLLLEAIDLYIEIDKHEKAGDLYKKIGLREKADLHYEKCLEKVLSNKDYLDASRIMREKMEQEERAKETLLNGWKGSSQAEPCLLKYFDIVAETEKEKMSDKLKDIYTKHTPYGKREPFLNVLVSICQRKNDHDLLETSRELAYEIISEEADQGKLTNLHTIKKFLPGDKLVTSDCSRYISSHHKKPKHHDADTTLQLDKSIRWISAVSHRNQLLALGIKDSHLHLARGDWYGNFEYYSWPDQVSSNYQFILVADPYHSNRVIIFGSYGITLEEKRLEKNKYFDDELAILCPPWLPRNLAGFTINREGGLSVVGASGGDMTLHHYSMDSSLKRSVHCRFTSEVKLQPHPWCDVIYRNDHYYTINNDYLIKISEDGRADSVDIDATLHRMAASAHFTKLRIAVSTDKGCLLFRPGSGSLQGQSYFFATDIRPVDMKFVSGNYLVIAGRHKIAVYLVTDTELNIHRELDHKTGIVSVLSTASRNQWAYLDETGKISICNIKND
jgi:tetratricopeptide (TPR) repeat protein